MVVSVYVFFVECFISEHYKALKLQAYCNAYSDALIHRFKMWLKWLQRWDRTQNCSECTGTTLGLQAYLLGSLQQITRGTTGGRNCNCVLFQNGVNPRALYPWASSEGSRQCSDANWYQIDCDVYTRHWLGGKKMAWLYCSAWRNCIFVWTRLTDVKNCCGLNCTQGFTEELSLQPYRKPEDTYGPPTS